MTITQKLSTFISLIRNVLVAADQNHKEECAAKEEAIKERDTVIEQLKAQLSSVDESIESAIAEFTPNVPANPTPAADAIVSSANELDADNTPEVQEAIDTTVGTPEETPPEAVDAAVEMLAESLAEETLTEDAPADTEA